MFGPKMFKMSINEIVMMRKLEVFRRLMKQKMLTTVNRFPAKMKKEITNTVIIEVTRISSDDLLLAASPSLTFADSMAFFSLTKYIALSLCQSVYQENLKHSPNITAVIRAVRIREAS